MRGRPNAFVTSRHLEAMLLNTRSNFSGVPDYLQSPLKPAISEASLDISAFGKAPATPWKPSIFDLSASQLATEWSFCKEPNPKNRSS
jgi:hypothetical protein